MKKNCTIQGFTLVEIAVVLVIIGLIIGGALVGKDLIAAARIRAVVSQVEQYNTAVKTFQGKYKYLPGDIVQSDAVNFGFYACENNQNPYGIVREGDGDGDGIISPEASYEYSAPGGISGEMLLLFAHLAQAQMISANIRLVNASVASGSDIDMSFTNCSIQSAINSDRISSIFPVAKLDGRAYLIPLSSDSINYYQLSGVTTVNNDGMGSSDFEYALTPLVAYAIDTKNDDGKPNSGATQARGGLTRINQAATAGSDPTDCTTASDQTGVYNTSDAAAANSKNCHLLLRM